MPIGLVTALMRDGWVTVEPDEPGGRAFTARVPVPAAGYSISYDIGPDGRPTNFQESAVPASQAIARTDAPWREQAAEGRGPSDYPEGGSRGGRRMGGGTPEVAGAGILGSDFGFFR